MVLSGPTSGGDEMIQVCASCCLVIGVNLKIMPNALSHGSCIYCACKMLRKAGVPESEIEEYKKEEICRTI